MSIYSDHEAFAIIQRLKTGETVPAEDIEYAAEWAEQIAKRLFREIRETPVAD